MTTEFSQLVKSKDSKLLTLRLRLPLVFPASLSHAAASFYPWHFVKATIHDYKVDILDGLSSA